MESRPDYRLDPLATVNSMQSAGTLQRIGFSEAVPQAGDKSDSDSVKKESLQSVTTYGLDLG